MTEREVMEAVIFGLYLDLKNMTWSGKSQGKVREFFIVWLLATLCIPSVFHQELGNPEIWLRSYLFPLFDIVVIHSQWNFAHATPALLSWHVQNVIVIQLLKFE